MIYVISGGAKAFAVIGVTYPAGSTCTCSDGTKTLKLKDTSGQGFFLIPYAGTWTVTATDGTNTKSESVKITSEGQSKSVELTYQLVLFDNGVVEPWTVRSVGNGSKIDDVLYASNPQNEYVTTNGSISTTDMINMTGYSKAVFVVSAYSNSGGRVGVCSSTNPFDSELAYVSTGSNTGTFEVDISGISESLYVYVLARGSASHSITVSKVWLE